MTTMNHLNEEQLIAFQDGDASVREQWAAHVSECDECRTELQRLDGMLAAFQSMPVPDPGDAYGRQVWQQIAPKLQEKRSAWWQVLFAPRHLAVAGLVTAMLLVAFFAGRVSRQPNVEIAKAPQPSTATATANDAQLRERVLMLAVGEHLGRSEMVLMDIANAQPHVTNGKVRLQNVNLSSQQRRAEDLLDENRLYRQTAIQEGDTGLANVLDELERVLLDVAHSPQSVTQAQFKTIRQRIDDDGLLFRVRVLAQQIQQQQTSGGAHQPAQGGSAGTKDLHAERNQA
jgi:hypothetical protein